MTSAASTAASFWPTNLTTEMPTAPIAVLKRAASELGQRTKNLLEGRVTSERVVDDKLKPVGVSHSFLVTAPTLDNYAVELFEVRHGDLLYPAKVSSEPMRRGGRKHREVKNETELADVVRGLLASDYVRKIVSALLAQVQA